MRLSSDSNPAFSTDFEYASSGATTLDAAVFPNERRRTDAQVQVGGAELEHREKQPDDG